MIRLIGMAVLAIIASGFPPGHRLNLARAEQPSEPAHLFCNLSHHKTEVETCSELRATSEALPPADLAGHKAIVGMPRPRTNGPESEQERRRRLYATALALYKATSRDAETFNAALLLPDVRQKIEAALRQKLSDQQCRELAQRAQAEAIYWYAYMQGMDRAETGDDKR